MGKTTITAEDELLAPQFRQKWIDLQSKIVSDEEIVQAIIPIWNRMYIANAEWLEFIGFQKSGKGYTYPNTSVSITPTKEIDRHTVINQLKDAGVTVDQTKVYDITIEDSPLACKRLLKSKVSAGVFNTYTTYFSIWLGSYAGMYEFARFIGLDGVDDENITDFIEWCRCVPFVLFDDEGHIYASRRPNEIHLNDEGQPHNDKGMAIKFQNGEGIWVLNGVYVDEQIVMCPETQTIDQIRKEQNEEVKRLRIERYGWERFLYGVNAQLVDENQNDIEGTKEFLYLSNEDSMCCLLCICPSTGKEFALEVPPETRSCREAQSWLSNGLSDRIISAS